MKIKSEHYQYMKNAIAGVASSIPHIREDIARDSRVKNPDMRLRWDICYRANLTGWICDNLYSYANDDHIDTALRSIIKELT